MACSKHLLNRLKGRGGNLLSILSAFLSQRSFSEASGSSISLNLRQSSFPQQGVSDLSGGHDRHFGASEGAAVLRRWHCTPFFWAPLRAEHPNRMAVPSNETSLCLNTLPHMPSTQRKDISSQPTASTMCNLELNAQKYPFNGVEPFQVLNGCL